MKEIRVEDPLGLFLYTLKGTDSDQLNQATEEFKEALDYINSLPYNMTNTYEQIKNRRNEIEEKYHIQIAAE